MSDRPRTAAPVLIAAAAVTAAAALAATVPRAADAPEPCCFANDRLEGMCKMVPGEGETCDGILAYLNNPMSTGKTYCGATTVRGGWVRVNCTTGKPMACTTPAANASATGPPATARHDGSGR